MTTAEEARKMFGEQTYTFAAHSGVEYTLRKPGPTFTMDVVEVSGIPMNRDPTPEQARDAGLTMYRNRKDIYEAVLPDYIVEPKVVPTDMQPAKGSMSLDELPDDDKWGIVQDLLARAAGTAGVAKADTFPALNTGAVAGPDGKAGEPTGE